MKGKDDNNDNNNDNNKIEKEDESIKIIEKVKNPINKGKCKTNLLFHITNSANGNCLFETVAYFKETLRSPGHELTTEDIEKCRRYAMTPQASSGIREQLYEIYNEMLVNPEDIIPFWGNVRFNQVMFELFNDNTLRNDLGYEEIRDEDIGTTKIEDEWKIHSCSFINKYISNTKNGVLPNGQVFWGNLRDLQCIAYNLNLKLCVIGIDTDRLEKKIVSLQHYDRPGSDKIIRVLNWAGVHFAACNWEKNIPIQRDPDIVPEPELLPGMVDKHVSEKYNRLPILLTGGGLNTNNTNNITNTIIEPNTKTAYSIFSKNGKHLLKKYIAYYNKNKHTF